MHIHKDNRKPYETYHMPIYTNDACLCYSRAGEDTEVAYLEVGFMFHVERTDLHWSTNFGETERIHLLLAL